MIQVRVVRHADAVPRAAHHAGDAVRPLSELGRRQAAAVAGRLDDSAVAALTAVHSSAAVRCVSTAEPLAGRAQLPVTVDGRLAEGSSAAGVLAMLDEFHGDTVLCSHGDVIGDLVHTLIGRGLILSRQADWAKASTWVLEVDGSIVAAARYEGPP